MLGLGLLWSSPASAHDAAEAMEVAAALESHGAYYAAYTELVGAMALAPLDEVRTLALTSGGVLWRFGQYQAAAEHFSRHLGDPTFALAHTYSLHKSGDLRTFDRGGAPLLQPFESYLLAWSLLEDGHPNDAVDTLLTIDPGTRTALFAQRMVNHISHNSTLRHRSPALAGALSTLVPGAGQVYSGKPAQALSALVVSGLFTGATVASARQENWGATVTFGLIGTAFYTGNVLSAVSSAKAYNKAKYHEFVGGMAHLRPDLDVVNSALVITAPTLPAETE